VTAAPGAAPDQLARSDGPLVETTDGLLLDLDGVVYVGRSAVPGAAEVLRQVDDTGVFLGYVTNNAARSAGAVSDHLLALGLPSSAGQVVTSAQLAAAALAAQWPAGSPILVVGGEGLHGAVTHEGLRAVTEAAALPVAVVQGFGPDVGWRQLAQASLALSAGAYWLATNLDRTVPTPEGRALGNGALVEALVAATGRRPDAVTGKPSADVFPQAASRWGLRRPLVVGDRLDTDIAGARAAGLPSLLVLTGVSTAMEVLLAGPGERPSFLGRDLWALLAPHPVPVEANGTFSLGGWSAAVAGDEVVVSGSGDPLAGLRAAATCAWRAVDQGREVNVEGAASALGARLGQGD
jgi:glycerol 3-phosphatase-2